ncbi:ABC transporter permease [Nocardioides guangzhouensis]|uniref:ABC transporter permease n=1 Tax=Nocardioides guangzhouensis TaxID=2497878 RepID=A0A4Q4ZJ23_9ACTN|nr:ABC transporter permease [Nocardioides guangzhouensis]RYP88280.1 ABC transporter permease [Nocardioides guangzhouensis]
MSALGAVVRPGRLSLPRSLRSDAVLLAAGVVLVAFVAACLFAPWLAPYDPDATDLGNVLAPSSPEHWLGTDQVGRDTLSRLLYGARTSLVGPLLVVVTSTVLGVLVGMVAGWRGGWLDATLSRVLDIAFAFPALLLAILAVSLFGKGLAAPVMAMSIAYTPFVARQVRGLVRSARSRPYVSAYAVQGFGPVDVALRRVLPNIAPVVLAQATVLFGYALLDLAALSFLGLGVQPPTSDWGAMINESRGAVLLGQPLTAVVPSVAVIVTVVAFNLLGEELGDRIARRDA